MTSVTLILASSWFLARGSWWFGLWRCCKKRPRLPEHKIGRWTQRLFTFLRHHWVWEKGGVWARTGRPAFTSARARLPLAPCSQRWRLCSKWLSATLGPCSGNVYPFLVYHHLFKAARVQDCSSPSLSTLLVLHDSVRLVSIMFVSMMTLSSAKIPSNSAWRTKDQEALRGILFSVFGRPLIRPGAVNHYVPKDNAKRA